MREPFISELLGTGPYPFPLDKLEDYTKFYESKSINIVITKTNISFVRGSEVHSHDSYEFLMPFKPMPYIGCDGRVIFVPNQKIFPINPFQEHGPQGEMNNSLFAAVHIASEFMRQVAQDIYGENDVVFKNEPVPISDELKTLIGKFTEEAVKSKLGNKLVMECLSTQIAVQLIRDMKAADEDCPASSVNAKTSLNEVVDSYTGNYLSRDYSTQSAAKKANLSKYHFIRAFRNETGKTPYSYLLDEKINKAKKLLRESNHTITEIYFLCGFVNHSHFTTTFKKKAGMSPSMYRKVHTLG